MRINWKILKSLFVFLIFLELFFWIGSWLTQEKQLLTNLNGARQKNVCRILCIGESTTMLGGNDSYPSQMERILNQKSPSHKFEVINQGMAGVNTTTIAQQLPRWLQMYKPDIVVGMIGILDPTQSELSPKSDPLPAFIKKIKLYQLLTKLDEKAASGIKEYIDREKLQIYPKPVPAKALSTEFDMFKDAMTRQSLQQRQLYYMIKTAEAYQRLDIAEVLYVKFLQANTDPVINHWVIKQYGNLLVETKQYDKFVKDMEYIPYDSWIYDWIKGYCHGEDHLERIRQTIERMVAAGEADPFIYGNVEACYEEGGRPDLALIYEEKMGLQSSYYVSLTRINYMDIKDILLSHGIQPVFVQYPMRDIRPLLSIFDTDPDREKIIFVDNGPSFQEAVRAKSYEFYFVDRMSGDTGHATVQGNHLLALNVAAAILKQYEHTH